MRNQASMQAALVRLPRFLLVPSLRQQTSFGLAQAVAHTGLVYALFNPWLGGFLASTLMYFFMAGFGISITAHRFLAHRSFHLPRFYEFIGSLMTTLSLQGSTVAWIAMHREHHRFADQVRDPHNPKGHVLRVHFLSMFYAPKLKYVVDLLRDPLHQRLHRHYWAINLGYAALLLLLGGLPFLVYLYLLPAALTWHGIGAVKTFAHLWGYRNYALKDSSRNLPIIGYLTFGEGWHNNHHAAPKQWNFKRRWFEWDPCATCIALGMRYLNFSPRPPDPDGLS